MYILLIYINPVINICWNHNKLSVIFFKPVRPNSIPKLIRNVFQYNLLLGSLRETAFKNADQMNSNLHNLASNEGILKTAVNELIKQSTTILTNSKTEENSIFEYQTVL